MRSESDEGLVKQVILLEKYSDFSDVFDKVKTDKLSKSLCPDLVIKLINDKQPPFRPIYNFYKPKLEMMHEYVKEILVKGFIQLSKSSSRASILFVPKKKMVVCAYG